MGVFFVSALVSFFYPVTTTAAGCSADNNPSQLESVTVKWVYDGDTLLLTDKRKIRLIVDTPEVKHHKQKRQAYAAKAREALRVLLKKSHYRVNLRYGAERKDRYSRTLAHVYTPSGINIANWLLEKGLASTMIFPPNIKLAHCYKQAEGQAQQHVLGIWRLKRNKIKAAANLSGRAKGHIRLKGRIKKVIHHKKSIIMELDSHSKRPIQIKIKKKHFRYFKHFDTDKLWDKTIIISGYLKNKRYKRTISLKHPFQIRVLSHKKIEKPTIIWSSHNAD